MRAKTAFVAGLGTAYLFDPNAGKRRRHVLRDRSLRALRRFGRAGGRKVRLEAGHVHGLVALLRRPFAGRELAFDDQTVAQRIRSDALRDAGVSARDIDVTVENGFARLRGSVDSIDIADRLVSRVRKVAGVNDVSAELRVADE